MGIRTDPLRVSVRSNVGLGIIRAQHALGLSDRKPRLFPNASPDLFQGIPCDLHSVLRQGYPSRSGLRQGSGRPVKSSPIPRLRLHIRTEAGNEIDDSCLLLLGDFREVRQR